MITLKNLSRPRASHYGISSIEENQEVLNVEWYLKTDKSLSAEENDLISRIDDALRDAKSIFSAPQVFVDPHTETEWRSRNSGILSDSEAHKILRLKKAAKYKMLSEKQLELVDIARSMSHQILQHN